MVLDDLERGAELFDFPLPIGKDRRRYNDDVRIPADISRSLPLFIGGSFFIVVVVLVIVIIVLAVVFAPSSPV